MAEAIALQDAGIRELIIIAQDTTDYGNDLGMKNGLSTLLRQIASAAPDIPWIRLMYAYPGYVTDELIETMAATPQMLPYLDIPLQHGHRETLKRMRRPANIEWVYSTVEKLRATIPDITIRTTFIVGYPGETDEEFDGLKHLCTRIWPLTVSAPSPIPLRRQRRPRRWLLRCRKTRSKRRGWPT